MRHHETLARDESATPRETYSTHELADALGVSIRTIATMRRERQLPAPVMVRRRTMWIRAEIREWLQAGLPDLAEWEAIQCRS